MEAATDASLHHIPVNLRNLQSAAFQPPHQTLSSQLGPDFDPNNFQSYPTIDDIPGGPVNGHTVSSNSHVYGAQRPLAQHRPRLQSQQVNGHHHAPDASPIHQNAPPNNTAFDSPVATQFPLVPSDQQYQQPLNLYTPVRALQQEESPIGLRQSSQGQSPHTTKEDGGGHFSGMKLVKDPANLEQWRQRLFNVDDTITLTEEEFQTYFPHIDNVYSHRSTQKYKRKPFVSHYWDCRLKGRPPGTPKSSDPNKKKRRRTARERDLCDVKIKITEYFPGAAIAMAQPDFGTNNDAMTGDNGSTMNYLMDPSGRTSIGQSDVSSAQAFGILAPTISIPADHPGAEGARYYTIQRINGNTNTGNEKPDSAACASQHKHSLEESDRVKKNSVQRWLLKEEKERKRSQATAPKQTTAPNPDGIDAFSSHPSGSASSTAKRHCMPVNPDSGLILYGSAFCPFAQRVWIALEIKQIPYQYIDVIPEHMPGGSGMRPPGLLEVNPLGVVPCVKHGNWGAWESGVLMEYLEDLSMGHPLLPLGEPQLRAHCRLWTDHINRKVLPAFYALLLTPPNLSTHSDLDPDPTSTSSPPSPSPLHATLTSTLQNGITALVNASHVTGPFFLGPSISFVDVAFAPWIIRLSRVLGYYRQWPDPEVGSRWEAWVAAIENDERVKATVSDEGSYHGVYHEAGCSGVSSLMGQSMKGRAMAEVEFARRAVREEGFGLGGDVWGREEADRRLLNGLERRQVAEVR